MKVGCLAVVALGVSSWAVAAPALADAKLTLAGFGTVRIGMTKDQAQRAAGGELVDKGGDKEPGCYFAEVATDPGVSFMIEGGRVSRVDIDDAHHQTLSGVQVGTTESQAQAVYRGRLEVRPHKYDPRGHYLILRSADKRSALVLETDGARVTSMRAGVVPAVEYVERCG